MHCSNNNNVCDDGFIVEGNSSTMLDAKKASLTITSPSITAEKHIKWQVEKEPRKTSEKTTATNEVAIPWQIERSA